MILPVSALSKLSAVRALGMGVALVAAAARAEPEVTPDWEGALGLVVNHGADYPGALANRTGASTGFYLRYGRFALSNTGAFVNRRHDKTVRGLSADLVEGSQWGASLGLRFDRGRKSSDSPALAGLPDVRPTVRARLLARWRPEPGSPWRAHIGSSTDILGNGGGYVLDAGFGQDRRIGPDHTWSWGVGLSWASRDATRNLFGVPAGSASPYPAYEPASGWRDANVSLGWRREFARTWVMFVNADATRLLGPARASPYVHELGEVSYSAGVARRF